MGGGGYGDPIDRDPAAVLTDVGLGLVTSAAAEAIYGVVIDDETATVDAQATDARRLAIRGERLGRGVEPELGVRAAVAPSGRPLAEYLQQTAEGETQCTWCGEGLAPAEHDWKRHATLRRLPLERAGAYREPAGEYVLIEACCPRCGTLLDTDVARDDDPPLNDRVRWAST